MNNTVAKKININKIEKNNKILLLVSLLYTWKLYLIILLHEKKLPFSAFFKELAQTSPFNIKVKL